MASPADHVRELLERIADALDLDADVKVEQVDGEIHAVFEGDEDGDFGLVIGRRGDTIDAIQHLATRAASHAAEAPIRVIVDAGGYRDRRREALERQGQRAADEAVKYHRAVALDDMTASDRRIVHEFLRDDERVETHSEGDDPHRHLVVTPVAS